MKNNLTAMRNYMRGLRENPRRTHCACGNRAARVVGTEGICARCDALQRSREVLCQKPLTAKKWSEVDPEGLGARFWKEKLEFWLPNPTPGWGSLEILERRLSV